MTPPRPPCTGGAVCGFLPLGLLQDEPLAHLRRPWHWERLCSPQRHTPWPACWRGLQEPATHGFFTLGSQAFSPHLLDLEGLLFRTQESRGLQSKVSQRGSQETFYFLGQDWKTPSQPSWLHCGKYQRWLRGSGSKFQLWHRVCWFLYLLIACRLSSDRLSVPALTHPPTA